MYDKKSKSGYLMFISLLTVQCHMHNQGMSTDFWQGKKEFGFQSYRQALEPTQSPFQWVLGAVSPGIKWLGSENDWLPQSNVEVKNELSYASIPT